MKIEAFSLALKEAEKALRRDEVPIGAVVVRNGEILVSAHNQTEKQKSFMAHAELLALQKASQKLNSKFLQGCELYVTLEPCMMCRFAAKLCRIDQIHYLASSLKFGRSGPGYFKTRINKSLRLKLLTQSSIQLLQDFFAKRR